MDPQIKTPVLQDKRLFVAVGAALSLLLASVFHLNVSPETVAGVVAIVVGWVTNSAAKEAAVAKAVAIAGQAAAEAAKVSSPADLVNK